MLFLNSRLLIWNVFFFFFLFVGSLYVAESIASPVCVKYEEKKIDCCPIRTDGLLYNNKLMDIYLFSIFIFIYFCT